MKVSRIAKVAGASLVGFCAVALAAVKVNVAPAVSQVAGFVGAFFGSLAAGRGTRKEQGSEKSTPSLPGTEDHPKNLAGSQGRPKPFEEPK